MTLADWATWCHLSPCPGHVSSPSSVRCPCVSPDIARTTKVRTAVDGESSFIFIRKYPLRQYFKKMDGFKKNPFCIFPGSSSFIYLLYLIFLVEGEIGVYNEWIKISKVGVDPITLLTSPILGWWHGLPTLNWADTTLKYLLHLIILMQKSKNKTIYFYHFHGNQFKKCEWKSLQIVGEGIS